MQTFEQWFDQDLTQPIVTRHCESVMFTADNLATIVGVRLYSGGAAAAPGGTCTGTAIRSDGGSVTFAGSVSANAVSASLPQAALAVPGPITVTLQTIDGSARMTVLCAVFTVAPSSTNTAVSPDTVIPDVESQIVALQATLDAICPDVKLAPMTLASVDDAMPLPAKALSVGIVSSFSWTDPAFYAEFILDEPKTFEAQITGEYTIYAEVLSRESGTSGTVTVTASDLGTIATFDVSVPAYAPTNANTTATGVGTFNGAISTITVGLSSAVYGTEGWPPLVRIAVIPGTLTVDGVFTYITSHPRTVTGWTGANITVSPTTTAADGGTVTVSWQAEAGTVYFGTLNVNTGTLTATHAALIVDGTEIAFTENTQNSQYRITDNALKSALGSARCISSWLPDTLLRINASNGFTYGTISGFGNIGITTLSGLNTLCAANPLVIIYPLATPAAYSLTPRTVQTLSGATNIWADCGDVAVTYKANPYTRLYDMITQPEV